MNRDKSRTGWMYGLNLVLVVVALVTTGVVLVGDSTECASADNEELCEKCGLSYEQNESLCQACTGRACFSYCLDTDAPMSCAQDFEACKADGGTSDTCRGISDAGDTGDIGEAEDGGDDSDASGDGSSADSRDAASEADDQ